MMLERARDYTPEEVLSLAYSNGEEQLDKLDSQKLEEAQTAAMFVTALNTIQQGVEDIKINLGSRRDVLPDVKVVFTEREEKKKREMDIEVVKFHPRCEKEGLMKFLKRTKLNPVYAYPKNTLILCSIEMNVKNPTDVSLRISEALNVQTQPHQIVMMFERENEDPLIAQVYPEYEVYGNESV